MISIIVPNYNCAPLIPRCIYSIKRQTHRNWECIIVDDGSTDGSLWSIKGLVDSDKRFKVIGKEQNEGLPSARNTGIAAAQGDAITFVDSDDWIEPLYLQELDVDAKTHPEAGRIFSPDFLEYPTKGWAWKHIVEPAGYHEADDPVLFTEGCDIGHSTGCLYMRDRIPVPIEFPKVRIFEDMIFNMGLLFAGVSIYINRKYLYRYVRRDGSSLSWNLTEKNAEEMRKVLADYDEKYNPSPELFNRCMAFLDNAIHGNMSRKK